ncbi:MAG TPA: ABC transporter permease [Pyrinomonadaceae bacterium]|jgi:lipopolysaccharide transport system permease protein
MTNAVSSEELPSLRTPKLPDEPLFVVEARKSGMKFHLKDWWTYRELLYFLIWRDVKIRYKQTLLGAAWAIIQPLFTMLIFTFIFGRVAKIDSHGIPYPLFAYSALLPWTFFSNAITTSGNSIVGSAHVITKVYFPRLIIPVAAVCAGLVDLAVAFPMLLALMLYYHIGFTLNFFFLFPLVLLTTLLAIAVGTWLSATNVKYRDVKFAMPFLIQIWMYLSPVAYPSSVVPDRWRLLYSLNPFVGIIEGYRAALFGQAFDWKSIGISAVLIGAWLVYSFWHFRKTEKTFADIV